MLTAFRSLRNYNYRVWAAGALVSNVGTWMQRTAQDWLVLAELTHKSATALGIVMALQFGPLALMLPFSGFAADHFDRRKLLIATQAMMGLLALGLSILTLSGLVRLWHVYVFAFLLGCVSAFDSTARQTFVAELVGEEDLSNAVGLNSTSFNAARMIGPAVAGFMIAAVGTGWVFLINALSFAGVLLSLFALRVDRLHRQARAGRRGRGPAGGLALRLASAGHQGDSVDAVSDRYFRHQLPDLHLDDVGRRIPHGGRGIRFAVLDARDRIGGGRAALCAAREGLDCW